MSAGAPEDKPAESPALADPTSPVSASDSPVGVAPATDLATVIAPAVLLSGRGLDSPPLDLGAPREEKTVFVLSMPSQSGPTAPADLRPLDAIFRQWDRPYGRRPPGDSSDDDDETADGPLGRGRLDWFLAGDDLI